MTAQTAAPNADDESLPVEPALEQSATEIESDAERTRSSLARLTSNSVDKLDGIVSEIQEMREFLKAEGERVQREIKNFAQLNQSVAAAATKIQTAAVGPWKSTKQPSSGRDRIKRWPAPSA